MGGGGLGIGKKVINMYIHQPVYLFVGIGATLHAYRWYQTQTTYNYWFGKAEFERRLERNQL